ncbi:MAG: penicillin-binding protein activator [Desulfatibacillaceae bacterium]
MSDHRITTRHYTARGILLLAMALLLLASCDRTVIEAPVPEKEPPLADSRQVYGKALRSLETDDLDQALAALDRYVTTWPDGVNAPEAHLLIGDIRYKRQEYQAALAAYNRVTERYPRSPEVPEAQYKTLAAYYAMGRYPAVVKTADEYLENIRHPKLRFGSNVLLGDSHMALGEPRLALEPYTRAYELAVGDQQEALVNRLAKAVDRLDAADLPLIMSHTDKCLIEGLVLLRLAREAMEESRWDAAGESVAAMVQRCPGHPRVDEARQLLADIGRLSNFQPDVLGVLLPLSGKFEQFGNQVLSGVEMALLQYNSWHDQYPVELIIRDTAGDPEQAKQAFQELAESGVAAVIGPMVTASALKETAARLRLPAVVFTQKSSVPEQGGYLFRNYLTPDMQTKALVEYGVNELGIRRFAILYPDDNYGSTYMNRFWDQVILHDAVVSGVLSYGPEVTDFEEHVNRLTGRHYERPAGYEPNQEWIPEGLLPSVKPDPDVEGDPDADGEEDDPLPVVDFDAVFIPDTAERAGLIMPQFTYHDVRNMTFMGTNLWHGGSLVSVAGRYANGSLCPVVFHPESQRPNVQRFVQDFSETFGTQPGFLEALGFDSANILFDATHRSGVRTRERLRTVLLQMAPYDGVTGRTSFLPTGEVDKDLTLLRLERGVFAPVAAERSEGMVESYDAADYGARPMDKEGGVETTEAVPDVYTGSDYGWGAKSPAESEQP